MKRFLLLFLLLPFVTTAQSTDLKAISGEYYSKEGKLTINYSDTDWNGEPESRVTFLVDGFFHSMNFSEADSERLGGTTVFLMEGLYYLVEIEPSVFAKITATPTWDLDGKDYVAAVYSRKKDRLSHWTDEAVNQRLLQLKVK
jgi:hypothetical protein